MEQTGKRMRELREERGLSQSEIARLCGSNQSTIGKMERGDTAPSVKLLIWFADYFDVSLDYLCGRCNEPQGKLYGYKPKTEADAEQMAQFIEMCFDPNSPYNAKLKETLIDLMKGATDA